MFWSNLADLTHERVKPWAVQRMDKDQVDIISTADDERPFDPAKPERSLLLAVLMSAMSDLNKNGSSSRHAVEYLLDPDEKYVFSFVSVCQHLDIDPCLVLNKLGLGVATTFQSNQRKIPAPRARPVSKPQVLHQGRKQSHKGQVAG
jgi:hypothetical protein